MRLLICCWVPRQTFRSSTGVAFAFAFLAVSPAGVSVGGVGVDAIAGLGVDAVSGVVEAIFRMSSLASFLASLMPRQRL